MLHRNVTSFVGLLGLLVAAPIQADNVNLSPVADVRILGFFSTTNFANDNLLSVYTVQGNVQRTLLQFDLGGIPAGQKIDSAVLTLVAINAFGSNPNNLNMDVHAVTTPWTENGATWINAAAGTPWAAAGGDFDPFVYATSTEQALEDEPVTWDVTDLVQNWYDGSIDNNGLLLRSFFGNLLTFDSSEQPNVAARPVLAVSYSAIPEASSMALLGLGAAVLIGMVGRKGRGNRPQATGDR